MDRSKTENTEDIPSELKQRLGRFDATVSEVESTLQPLLSTPYPDLLEKLGPLDTAKLDLVAVYSINSLFWMYLNTCGVNPKDHPVKTELDRIRSYMTRIKEAQDSLNKPRLDKGAAKRFITHSLGDEKAKQKKQSPSTSTSQTPKNKSQDKVSSRGRKRKCQE